MQLLLSEGLGNGFPANLLKRIGEIEISVEFGDTGDAANEV